MRIGHIELFVTDPARARRFYEDVLGFTVAEEQEGGFVWLTLDGTEVLLRPGKPGATPAVYANARSGLVLYTEDLAAKIEELTARGLELHGTDGACPAFHDPDGHWFQLVAP